MEEERFYRVTFNLILLAANRGISVIVRKIFKTNKMTVNYEIRDNFWRRVWVTSK